MVDLWSIVEMTIGPYIDMLGGVFWIAILMLGTGIVYVRIRDFGPTFMVFAVGFLALHPVLPGGQFWGGAFIIVAIGIAYSLYRLIVKSVLRG